MNIFVDTAAFLAVLNSNDHFHSSAKKAWQEILLSDVDMVSSNYVLLETTALLQHRFGIEAVRLLESDILPVVEIVWIDEAIHRQGLNALLAANRRQLSLVDCTSFQVMRQMGLSTVFTFDPHFGEQGFTVTPPGDHVI
jgi:predicted nucleic acid-binding protein